MLAISWSSISQAKINGQIFIIQRNQAVVKLALVTVSAHPEHQFYASIKEAKGKNDKIITDLTLELTAIKEEINELHEVIASGKKELQPMAIELKATNTKPNYAERYEVYWRLYERVEKAEDAMAKKEERAIEIKKLISNLKNPESYITNLPNTIYKAKSNADGHFTLNVPRGVYVLSARSSRLIIGDNAEQYLWLVRVDTRGGGADLFLSNDNLYETSCNDCIRLP